ncbi:MAG: 50S ribosomal protein L33 [Firmicutes bacterium]|nr:50S ribosomal protein L33 [Bacillota bacterium]MDD4693322.1 50S ribosomal protein L33 [Bacillota bacterium]
MRIDISLECTKCGRRNYRTSKSKTNNPDRLEITKFCAACRERTPHKETK